MATKFNEKASAKGVSRQDVGELLKGGTWPWEAFLVSGFATMPRPVRIGLYLLIALLVVYTQLILPTLITGRLVNTEDRDKILLGTVSYWVSDHQSSTEVSRSGSWSVPMFARLPKSIQLEVKIVNSGTQTVQLDFLKILAARITADPIEIRATRLPSKGEKDSFRLDVAETYLSEVVRSALARLPLSDAFAQQPRDAQRADARPRLGSIEDFVLSLAERLAAEDRRVFPTERIADRIPNPLDQSDLIQRLQNSRELYIPLSTIERLTTFGDLIEEIRRQTTFQEKFLPKLKLTLSKYQQRRDFFSGEQPPPETRITTFSSIQGMVPSFETDRPAAFLDATLFGTGAQGILFGKTGIYYRTDFTLSSGPRNGFVAYDEFTSRRFQKGAFLEVSFDRGQNFVTAGSGVSQDRLLEILVDVQRLVADAKK